MHASGFEEGEPQSGPAYYVSVNSGHDNNAGTRSAPWKTITRAVRSDSGVQPGSTIFVEAGTYPEQVVVQKDDIRLIGYKNTPGDQPPILVNQAIDSATLGSGYPFNANDMLLDGGNRASGTGIDLRGRQKVTVRNFSLHRYAIGVNTGSASQNFVEGHVLDNVNVSTIGNISASYHGMAMSMGSVSPRKYAHGNVLTNILIVNAAAEGLKIFGDDNDIDTIRVYGAETGLGAIDYYIVVFGSRNHVNLGYIWRKPHSTLNGGGHWGHAYTIKDNSDQRDGGGRLMAENNVFENVVAEHMGEGFAVRHRGVRYNTFRNATARGQHAINHPGGPYVCHSSGDDHSAIVIRDGASHNQFIDIEASNTCRVVSITDTEEDENGVAGVPSNDPLPRSPSQNLIENLHSTDTAVAVSFSSSGIATDAGDNTLRNAVFVDAETLFVAYRPSTGMKYENSTFDSLGVNVGLFGYGSHLGDVKRSQFTGCTFTDVKLPVGW